MVNNLLHIFHQSLKRRLTDEEIYEINGLLGKYPYFSLLHQLKAKYAPTRENIFVASTYATSRELLQSYLGGTLYLTQKEMISEMRAPSSDEIHLASYPANDTFSIVDFNLPSSGEKIREHFSIHVSSRSKDIHEFLNTEIRIRTAKYFDLIRRVRAELSSGIRVLMAPKSEEVSAPEKSMIESDQETNHLLYKKGGRVVEISVSSEQYKALFSHAPVSTPPADPSLENQQEELKEASDLKPTPELRRKAGEETPPDENIAKSILPDEEMISETLAELHLRQGNKKDAIEIYQKLSLLFPEKSSYFVALIKKLKEE